MLGSIVNFFAGWQVKLAVVLIVLASLFAWHKHEVSLAVVQATSQMELEYAKEKFKLLDKANTTTVELKDQVAQIEQDKNVKIKALNARVAALTASLSSRPDRPASNGSSAGSTSNSESSTGATGLRLYRPDAEFLVWFAGETAELQTELKACYRQYDEVKIKLDKFRLDNQSKQ